MIRLFFASLLLFSNLSFAQLLSPKSIPLNQIPKIGREWLVKQNGISEVQITAIESQINKTSLEQANTVSVLNVYLDVGNKDWLNIRSKFLANQIDVSVITEFLKKSQDEFFKSNASLYLGRELAISRHYEEALNVLTLSKDMQVIDPAMLYFYKAVSANKTRQKDLANQNIKHLLNKTFEVPDRYLDVAAAMQEEMENWQERDEGDLARRMSEVEGDLSNAKGGPKTQAKQKEIISILDELIAKKEKEMNDNNSSGQKTGKNHPSQPMPDSRIIKDDSVTGDVENKKLITSKDNWGNLPEKEKVKALEAVHRQLPPHIREAAEGFSKKLQQGG